MTIAIVLKYICGYLQIKSTLNFFLCFIYLIIFWLFRTEWWCGLDQAILKSAFLNHHPHRFVLCCSLPASIPLLPCPSVPPCPVTQIPGCESADSGPAWAHSGCLPQSSLNCWCESVFSQRVQRSLLIPAALANLLPCAAVQAVTSSLHQPRPGSPRALCSLRSTLPPPQ